MKSNLLGISDYIGMFFNSLATALTADVVMYILLGLFIGVIVYAIVRTQFSYEIKAIKAFKKINKYFEKKPYINDTNIEEFNTLMKIIPYQLRDRWQHYMLNRDALPSAYFTLYHCIEQPIKTSSYKATTKFVSYLTCVIAILAGVIGLFSMSTAGGLLTATGVTEALLAPILYLIASVLFMYFLHARFNALSIDIYEFYVVFIKNLDKASVSMPDYVDYEILFTAKEIRDSIPLLADYLDMKSALEKKKREQEGLNLREREKFDFSKAGIDGSLVIERSMETSQDFLNTRRRYQEEILKLEEENSANTDQFQKVDKESQKKLQVIKENLERLQASMEASATKIETNYIKKQIADEVRKQEEIEKSMTDLRQKYEQEVEFLKAEIEKRQSDIELSKSGIQEKMYAEFQTFAEKAYTQIRNSIDEENSDDLAGTKQDLSKNKEQLKLLERQNEKINLELEIKQQKVNTLEAVVENLKTKLERALDKRGISNADLLSERAVVVMENKIDADVARAKAAEQRREVQIEAEKEIGVKVQNTSKVGANASDDDDEDDVKYFDKSGKEVNFADYYDENGHFKVFPKVYDKDGNYYDFALFYDKYGNPLEQGALEAKPASKERPSSGPITIEEDEEFKGIQNKIKDAKIAGTINISEKISAPTFKENAEELKSLQGEIDSANEQLKQKQNELKQKISVTLTELNEKPTQDRNLTEIRAIIKKLKTQAAEAKANGLSKTEQAQINKSLAELLSAMAKKTEAKNSKK